MVPNHRWLSNHCRRGRHEALSGKPLAESVSDRSCRGKGWQKVVGVRIHMSMGTLRQPFEVDPFHRFSETLTGVGFAKEACWRERVGLFLVDEIK